MSTEMKRTYTPWQEFAAPSKQTEYTEATRMLADDGTLLVKGWARRNVFDYDRTKVDPQKRGKEWDFYQLSDGNYMVQVSFANISIGGYASASLVDLKSGKILAAPMSLYFGGKNKYVLPPKGDEPNTVKFNVGKAVFEVITEEKSRTIHFKMGEVECDFQMDILDGHENITTVLPFAGLPKRFFMTTKQNCMPCAGTFRIGDKKYEFGKDNTFCVLDWGRVNTPYRMIWYWGNGSSYVTGPDGKQHIFGFEITWGIGDESNATETCIFYDGKAHKFGAIDVETFPKPDKYMEPWHFVSEDGKFDMTMKPFYDHHSDLNVLNLVRMHSHQVHGLWSGTATLEDGTKLEIKDMYAFCEYVENKW